MIISFVLGQNYKDFGQSLIIAAESRVRNFSSTVICLLLFKLLTFLPLLQIFNAEIFNSALFSINKNIY